MCAVPISSLRTSEIFRELSPDSDISDIVVYCSVSGFVTDFTFYLLVAQSVAQLTRLGAEQLLRGFRRLPNPCDDLVSLVFGDRDELKHGVASLGRVEEGREFPRQLGGECLINLTVAVDYTTQDPTRAVAAAELVDDRVVGDRLSQVISPGSLGSRWYRAECR